MKGARAPHVSDPNEPVGHAVRTALFDGQLQLWQPAAGYRVNVDTLLLAQFAATCRPKARRLVDLGAGVGALSLAYAFFGSAHHADLVEKDAGLASLAARNLQARGQAGDVHTWDLSRTLPAGLRAVADVVLSNPPFFARGGRSQGANPRRDAARRGELQPFLERAAEAMGRRSYAFFAYPAAALPELIHAARGASLVLKRLRLVHAFASSPARLSLVELRRAKPGGLVVEPPIIEWTEPNVRTELLARITAGRRD